MSPIVSLPAVSFTPSGRSLFIWYSAAFRAHTLVTHAAWQVITASDPHELLLLSDSGDIYTYGKFWGLVSGSEDEGDGD